MKSNNTTIVINTCDAYEDVLRVFFAAFDDYWPNSEYPIVINSETKNFNNIKAITHLARVGEFSWGKRLRSTLESIDTEFVLMLYDDFILDAPVRLEDFYKAEQLLIQKINTSVVYLVNTNLPLKTINTTDMFLPVLNKCNYRLNSFPGLWRRKDILLYTGPNDNPWAWEFFGTYRTFETKTEFYSLNPIFQDIYPYDYQNGGAIYRGKWVKRIIDNNIRKYKLNIDPLERGYSSDVVDKSRKVSWMINFIVTGFKMIGLKVFRALYDLLKIKFNVR